MFIKQKHGQTDGRLIAAVGQIEYHLWTGERRVLWQRKLLESVYKVPDGACRPVIDAFISQYITAVVPEA